MIREQENMTTSDAYISLIPWPIWIKLGSLERKFNSLHFCKQNDQRGLCGSRAQAPETTGVKHELVTVSLSKISLRINFNRSFFFTDVKGKNPLLIEKKYHQKASTRWQTQKVPPFLSCVTPIKQYKRRAC